MTGLLFRHWTRSASSLPRVFSRVATFTANSRRLCSNCMCLYSNLGQTPLCLKWTTRERSKTAEIADLGLCLKLQADDLTTRHKSLGQRPNRACHGCIETHGSGSSIRLTVRISVAFCWFVCIHKSHGNLPPPHPPLQK